MSRKTISKKNISRLRDFASSELYCPITRELFHDPVVAEDGILYEREAIQKWFKTRITSPITGKPFTSTALFPMKMVRRTIDTMTSLRMLPSEDIEQLKITREKSRIQVNTLSASSIITGQSLVHAFSCRNSSCLVEDCACTKQIIRRMIIHTKSCSKTECKICRLHDLLLTRVRTHSGDR